MVGLPHKLVHQKPIEFQATSGVQGGHDCTIISFEVPF